MMSARVDGRAGGVNIRLVRLETSCLVLLKPGLRVEESVHLKIIVFGVQVVGPMVVLMMAWAAA